MQRRHRHIVTNGSTCTAANFVYQFVSFLNANIRQLAGARYQVLFNECQHSFKGNSLKRNAFFPLTASRSADPITLKKLCNSRAPFCRQAKIEKEI